MKRAFSLWREDERKRYGEGDGRDVQVLQEEVEDAVVRDEGGKSRVRCGRLRSA